MRRLATHRRLLNVRQAAIAHVSCLPLRLDTNPLGESIRGRLGRVYDAADIERLRHNRPK
jgi:hypothetical protein